MDDSFAFRSTVPIRREVDPRLVRGLIGLGIVLIAIGWFAHWVIASERRSFAEADRSLASTAVPVSPVEAPEEPAATIEESREAVDSALLAAQAAFTEHRSFLGAGPTRLTELQPGYSFVDGPSTSARIVSVASTEDVWAAAVLGPDGTCLWIRATSGGDVTRSLGTECTGSAALAAADHR